MKKIKEKPTLSERIKEKAISTPRELLHRGLDDGSERLRTQLRDTAQHGQADEYGGDTIEDTAARGLRRAEKELIRQRKKKPQEQPPEGGAPAADGTDQKTQSLTERSRRPLRSVDGSRRVRTPRKKPPRSRPKTPISAHRQRHRSQWQRNRSGRDSRYSWRNAGAKPPDGRQNKKEPYRAARSRRRKPCVQMGAAAPCPTGNVQRRLLTSKNGLKPACPNRRGRTACRWNVTSSPLHRIPGRWLIQQRLWSPHRSRRPCCKAAPAPHGK